MIGKENLFNHAFAMKRYENIERKLSSWNQLGGFLANLPKVGESLLKAKDPNATTASWALRFTMDLKDIIAVLSGMSTLDQMRENIRLFKNPKPLTSDEKDLLKQVVSECKKTGPYKISDFTKYSKYKYHGVPISAILDANNSAQIQPRPDFALDDIYLRSRMLEDGNIDCTKPIPKQKIVMDDGTDITEMVDNAIGWLIKHFL